EDVVFAVIDGIKKQLKNKKITNKKIIESHNISERTFYRIKAGDKKYLKQFEAAVQKESKEFFLALSE
ncbi:helix-turn-helix domain-containing protein, partial [Brucella sp. 09RB8918]